MFGPWSSSITHEPDDGFLEVADGFRTGDDVVVEVEFSNPYTSASKYWQHGLLLRHKGGITVHWVSIDNGGYWDYFYRLNSADALGRIRKFSPDIRTSPGQENTLRVVMIGPTGWLYINGIYQETLDLSAIIGAGLIRPFVDDDHDGETNYKNFRIWTYGLSLSDQLPDVGIVPTPVPAWEALVQQASTLSFDEIFRNNESYIGDLLYFEGEIVQVIQASGRIRALRVNVTKGDYYWGDTIYLRYRGPRLLEDDIIEFVARLDGLYTYEAINGASITLPDLTVMQSHLVTKASDR